MTLDAEIDRLYGLPIDEFVHARDELAKRLRGEDREAASQIKTLRKPTVGAWALNQAVRRRARERDALLAAGEQLRAAHAALLSGGDPSPLRDATKAERTLVATLTDTAEAIATKAGKGGAALKDRVRGTLHAAAVDEDVRDELAAGRVVRERDAVGIGPFGASVDAPVPPTKTSRPRGAKAAERKRAERLAAAEHALADARTALAETEAAHDDAVGDVDSARSALADAEAAEREARKLLRERAKQAAKREREAERLRSKPTGARRRG